MNTRTIGAMLVISSLVATVLWLAGGSDYARPRPFAGDHLGPQSGQTHAEYRELADDSLAVALRRAPSENAFSMLGFTTPLSAMQTGELVADLQRVGSIITKEGKILATPEPVAGAMRADAIRTTLAAVNSAEIIAVIAFDTPTNLAPLTDQPAVHTIEVLPPDAVWSQFGISPPSLPAPEAFEFD